jgi:hypothetical protein
MGNVRVKSARLIYAEDNRFNLYINSITGYGYISPPLNDFNNLPNINVIGSNIIFLGGQIMNPTGIQPAIFYQTGILNGFINTPGVGSFTWDNIFLSAQGRPNEVFLNYFTGAIQAKNTIQFNNNLLTDGDTININNTFFTYATGKNPNNLLQFDSFQNLIDILNSGSTGAFDNIGFGILRTSIGITGFINGNILNLFSYLQSGEDGNNIKIYRNCQNLDAIKLPSRYFTGGRYLRPRTNTWYGNFSRAFPTITAENSGIYSENISEIVFDNISGLVWIDNFSGNYYITTGIKDPNAISLYSGSLVPFKNNIYIGSGVIPSGQFTVATGLKIDILKPNPYNIIGNFAKYIFSGDGFLFSGIIEG